MSEHIWVNEHLAAYVADGLDAAERERVDSHVAECETCAQVLADLRSLDSTVENLFADARPAPALEDRMILALRSHRPRKRWSIGLRVAACIAALVALGVIGTVGTGLLAEGTLRFPGTSAEDAIASARDDSDYRNILLTVQETQTGSLLFGVGSKSRAKSDAQTPPAGGSAAGVDANDEAYKLNKNFEGLRVQDSQAAGKEIRATKQLDDAKFKETYGYTGGDRAGIPLLFNPSQTGGGFSGGPGGATAPGMPVGMPTSTFIGTATSKPADKAPVYHAPVDFDGVSARTSPAAPPMSAAPEKAAERKGDGSRSESNAVRAQRPAIGVAGELGSPVDDPNTQGDPARPAENPAVPRQIVIRSGEIEFEITSFDDAVATVTRLVGPIKGGFIATVNSEKLANGKVRGSVVVRVPPERLDALVLDLRKELSKTGELKKQRIGSQDITKQYTDLESRLKAARAMEERLLKIIKDGTGQIKDLIAAEKELGNWRTQIESLEGELRYYSNLVALSTLTITLYEKEIRAAAAMKETERIDMGIEVEDVEKAHRDALAAVTEFKGRVAKAELKQSAAGQFNALLQFQASPESAGPLRDRLKQLGNVARMQIDRLRQPEGGTGNPTDGKVDRVDTVFIVSLYNLTGLAPRETVLLKLVAPDAEAAYKQALARAQKATGKIISSQLNSQRADQTNGRVQFEVKTAETAAVLEDLRKLGEVMSLQTTENPDAANVTRAKQGFHVEVWALSAVQPRETIAVELVMRDVSAGFRNLQDAVAKAKGRTLNAQLNEQDRSNVTGELDFEIRRGEEDAIRAALAGVGDVYSRNVVRAANSENVIDSKLLWRVKLMNVTVIAPTETVSLDLEVKEVEPAVAAFASYITDVKGRIVNSNLSHDPSGRVTANVVYDVPLTAAPGLIERLKAAGAVRGQQVRRNSQAKESDLAVARLEVGLGNEQRIVPKDEGLWTQVRKGLATSFVAISWSVVVVIIGLCFVLPWAVVMYVVYLIWRRVRGRSQAA